MKIPVVIVSIFLTGILALEGWTLNEVVKLKTDVAAIKSKLDFLGNESAINHNQSEAQHELGSTELAHSDRP